jgi:hypothetical protein
MSENIQVVESDTEKMLEAFFGLFSVATLGVACPCLVIFDLGLVQFIILIGFIFIFSGLIFYTIDFYCVNKTFDSTEISYKPPYLTPKPHWYLKDAPVRRIKQPEASQDVDCRECQLTLPYNKCRIHSSTPENKQAVLLRVEPATQDSSCVCETKHLDYDMVKRITCQYHYGDRFSKLLRDHDISNTAVTWYKRRQAKTELFRKSEYWATN